MPPVVASAAFIPAVTGISAGMAGLQAIVQNKNIEDAYDERKRQLEAQNKQRVADITRRSNAMIGKMRAAYGYSGIGGATVLAAMQAQLGADTIDVNRTDRNTYLGIQAARSEAEASMSSPLMAIGMGALQGWSTATTLQNNLLMQNLLKPSTPLSDPSIIGNDSYWWGVDTGVYV